MDHTELDIELVSSQTGRALGRPWISLLTDAFSRSPLAMYLTYDPPSHRSCMMLLRDCVARHHRLPDTIVVDGGSDFRSVYFEALLAYFGCTKKTRPAAQPRFGSVIERLFGTTNTQFVHTLRGNVQARDSRHVTLSDSARALAVWTLADLYAAFCDYLFGVYLDLSHPALGDCPRTVFARGSFTVGHALSASYPMTGTSSCCLYPVPAKEQPRSSAVAASRYIMSSIGLIVSVTLQSSALPYQFASTRSISATCTR